MNPGVLEHIRDSTAFSFFNRADREVFEVQLTLNCGNLAGYGIVNIGEEGGVQTGLTGILG